MAEWETQFLGDVAQLTMGQSPKGSLVKELESGLPFLQGNGEFGSRFPKARFECDHAPRQCAPGDSLISVRAPVGDINRSDRGYGIGRGLAAVTFKSVDSDFGHYALIECSRHLDRVSQGTTFSAIGRAELAALQLPVPLLEEQRRIAEILDTVNETIQATERVIAKQRVILSGLQESLLEANDGATRTTVGDLVSRHWPGEWGEGVPRSGSREVIVLRATNLDDYGVDYSTGARRFVAGLKVAEKRLMDGDLLIEAAGGGLGVPVGRVRQFRQPPDDRTYLTSNFFRTLRPKAGVSPDYLFWMLDLEYRKPSIWSCQQQTTGIINLQVRDYLRRPVIYHHRSQGSIARTLNAALRAVEVERQQLQKLRETRSGLAADLLSGRVRTVAA